MKLPFRKSKSNESDKKETLQSLQQDFNQVLFEIGDLNYRKHMITAELTKVNSELNTRVQKADAMGVRAASLRALAQQELASTVKEGEKDASEASKAD